MHIIRYDHTWMHSFQYTSYIVFAKFHYTQSRNKRCSKDRKYRCIPPPLALLHLWPSIYPCVTSDNSIIMFGYCLFNTSIVACSSSSRGSLALVCEPVANYPIKFRLTSYDHGAIHSPGNNNSSRSTFRRADKLRLSLATLSSPDLDDNFH